MSYTVVHYGRKQRKINALFSFAEVVMFATRYYLLVDKNSILWLSGGFYYLLWKNLSVFKARNFCLCNFVPDVYGSYPVLKWLNHVQLIALIGWNVEQKHGGHIYSCSNVKLWSWTHLDGGPAAVPGSGPSEQMLLPGENTKPQIYTHKQLVVCF